MTNRVEAVRVPTICALNGSIYGGATDLALACDFRIGVFGMRFVMPAGRLGVHYYPSGLQRYVTRLGLGPAKKLFLTAEPLDVDEMLRVGFLDEVVTPEELDARVDELANRIAGNAPLSLRGMKRALNDIVRGELDHDRIRESRAACENSEDVAEGIAAWSERRTPMFKGR
jgi:enoyl-CoA hydratase/carnithine racemase